MSSHIKGSSFLLKNVYIHETGTIAGPMEKAGPLMKEFDEVYDDLYLGEKTFEQAERRYVKKAVLKCLEKNQKSIEDIDLYLGGDLLNQIVTSHYLARDLNRPFIGLYGACSTSCLSIAVASLWIEGNLISNALAFTSSHNATAERQYRYPVEYGIQKCETTTFTATGAGAILLSNQKSQLRVESITFGKVIDLNQKNPNDMGRAMAPAAYDTILTHFKDLNRSFDDYDLVITGDLSTYGKRILKQLFIEKEMDPYNLEDCGCLLYHQDQPVFQGGSGCACSALVAYGYLFNELKKKKYKRILLLATGALLSPIMSCQKESIPCVCHGISVEVCD